MPSTANVRGGGPSSRPVPTAVRTNPTRLILPADVDVTRFATVTGRPQTITPAAIPTGANPKRFSVEFWNTAELYDDRNSRMNADIQVTEETFKAKLSGLAERIRSTNPDVIGLAGIENLRILEALAGEHLADLGYNIVHIDSPDPAGLDSAILTRFPMAGEPSLHVVRGSDATRGVLEATLRVGDVPLTLFVAHAKADVRTDVARMLRHLVAEKHAENPAAEIMLMGDLGVPLDDALFDELGATGDRDAVRDEADGAVFFHTAAEMAERAVGQKVTSLDAVRRHEHGAGESFATTFDAGGWTTHNGILVTSGLLDDEGLRIVKDATVTVRDHLIQGRPDPTVSRHLRVRTQIERVVHDEPRLRTRSDEGQMVAPGVWLNGGVASVRHRIGDAVAPHDPATYDGLTGADLAAALERTITRPLVASYYDARAALFKEIANKDGWVECVYTGRRIQADDIPLSEIMNTEHSRPASRGVMGTKFIADLHHLFPTDSKANTRRGSVPFGVVKNVEWEDGGSKFGTDAEGRLVFEPRDEHKGTVARALAYLTMHGLHPEPWQTSIFVAWNELDEADDAERRRNDLIAKIQGNRNPFIDDSSLMARLWS